MMSHWDNRSLSWFEARAKAEKGEAIEITPSRLLRWFGAHRRGRNVVSRIKGELEAYELTTVPDFDAVWLYAPITLVRLERVAEQKGVSKPEIQPLPEPLAPQPTEPIEIAVATEPAHRISRLEAAQHTPVSVKPGATLAHAVTLMMQHDYSQLPVMASPGTVKGMVSWRSIGTKLHLGIACKSIDDCMDKAYEVRSEASLFDAVRLLATHDALLVRASNGIISGIVTNADIGAQFGALAEPFLLLGDIENALRHLIGRSFTLHELKGAIDPTDKDRKVESVNDLAFGEYLRLVENPANWDRLKLPLDRAEVVKQLHQVRDIRNDIMHFDPDPLDPESLQLLRNFAKFLPGVVDLLK